MQEYRQEFPPELLPPTHMPVAFGLVKAKKVTATQAATGGRGDADDADDDGLIPLSQVGVPRCAVCKQKMKVNDKLP